MWKNYYNLNQYKVRKNLGLFLIENKKNIQLAEEHLCKFICKLSTIPEDNYNIVSKNELYKITNNRFITHIAIIQDFSLYNESSNKACYEECNEEFYLDLTKPIIILDNVLDYGNLGSIFRTCAALNIDQVFCILEHQDLCHHKVIESSRGYIFSIKPKILSTAQALNLLDIIRDSNIKILATDMQGISIHSYHNSENYCLILGNESDGINPEIKMKAHHTLTIPIHIESLNVSVALGIILYSLSQ